MMTVHKIAGIDGPGYADYLTGAGGQDRRGDYYLGRSGQPRENVGTWHGQGAEELGLSGTVRRVDLLRAWEGRDPRTGEIVVSRGSTGEHVAGVDVTFSAPKSVSVLWALSDVSGRADVEAAHDQATLVALRHIERNVPLVRRRLSEDEVVHEQAAGIIAARFRHHTSRLTDEQHARGEVPDPQLHDHVAIANMAKRAGDGKWVAIDSRELFRVAAEGGAVYRAELAARLQQLGYRITRDGRYFEVDGISARLREVFSARSEEVGAAVRRFIQEYGRPPTIAERKALTVLSRSPKSVDHAPAFEQWTRRANERGGAQIPAPDVAARPTLDRHAALAEVIADLTDPESPYFLNREHAAVDGRTFRTAVAEAAQGRLPGTEFDWLLRRVQQSPDLQQLGSDHWAARVIVEAEQEVVATAQRKAATIPSPLPEAVAAAIAGARVPLSVEQRAAVEQLARTDFGLLAAQAGAGKGEVLRAVAQVRKSTGHRVIAVAAAGETAQRFGREINADVSMTVEGFALSVAKGRLILTERDAVFVDEGGLLEDMRWLRLVRASGPASITATGDAAQLSPIEAGGLWPRLTHTVGAATLSENFRAREQWMRDAWTDLREGRASRAVGAMDQRRQIVISTRRSESRDAAVARWDEDRRAGAAQGRGIENYLLLATTTNYDVDQLNAMAQQRRRDAGELGAQSIEVTAQDHSGNDRTERFHVGDRVVTTRQVRLGTHHPRVENGAIGTVAALNADTNTIEVQLAERAVTLHGPQLTALRLNYAQHAYPALGRSVDRTYIVTGSWQAGRETTYATTARSREATFLFTDYSSLRMETHDRDQALHELAARASESQAKVSALDVMEKHQARTEGLTTRATATYPTRPKHELGAPRPNAPQQLEQHRDAEEAAQRQARERMDRERQQIEDDLQRQHERDGGIER
ncbi:MAG TPA: MobF family relaxase [Candidatus Angelobacter sp.]|jgi:conjugative relaxase-like TrwC/TraI family protein|nr:MobF family relaxase [Candidatus Angelobacter sp.]